MAYNVRPWDPLIYNPRAFPLSFLAKSLQYLYLPLFTNFFSCHHFSYFTLLAVVHFSQARRSLLLLLLYEVFARSRARNLLLLLYEVFTRSQIRNLLLLFYH